MRKIVKHQDKRMAKRTVFAELTEGMAALAESREGKRTLRTHAAEFKPAPTVMPKELIRVRQSLNMSRALLPFTFGPMFALWKTGNKDAPNRMLRRRF